MSIDRRLTKLEMDAEIEAASIPYPGAPLMLNHDLTTDVYQLPGEAPMTPAEYSQWRAGLAKGRIVIVVNRPREDKK